MDGVLNWVWQGIVVALAATALLAVTRAPARVRYLTAVIGLMAVLIMPLVTRLPTWSGRVAEPSGPVWVDAEAVIWVPAAWWTADWFLLSLWIAWMSVAAARMVVGFRALGRARGSSQPFPADVEQRLSQWRAIRASGRPARLVLSNAVRTAAVFGGRMPLIAVAPHLLATLPAADLDRVVVHEWAHVQWHDEVVHRMQVWIRVLAGWHPAVWWLDRQVHFEREAACDEHAVRLTGSPRAYAGCLARLATLAAAGQCALPAVGAGSHLRRRVMRILIVGPRTTQSRWVTAGVCSLPLAVAVGIADVRIVAAAPVAVLTRASNAALTVELLADGDVPMTPAIAAISQAAVSSPPPAINRLPPATRSAAPPEARHLHADSRHVEPLGVAPFADVPDREVVPGTTNALESRAQWAVARFAEAPPVTGGPPPIDTVTLWHAAATGGVAIGRGSHKAAVSTAGFFARVGRSIAGSF